MISALSDEPTREALERVVGEAYCMALAYHAIRPRPTTLDLEEIDEVAWRAVERLFEPDGHLSPSLYVRLAPALLATMDEAACTIALAQAVRSEVGALLGETPPGSAGEAG